MCMSKEIWLTTAHIPGINNVIADTDSRVFDDSKEWKLHREIFIKLTKTFGMPDVDMFASH